MGNMLSTGNPAVVAAFHPALAKQGLINGLKDGPGARHA